MYTKNTFIHNYYSVNNKYRLLNNKYLSIQYINIYYYKYNFITFNNKLKYHNNNNRSLFLKDYFKNKRHYFFKE